MANPGAQMAMDDAKKEFDNSKTQYFKEKEKAEADHQEELDAGMTQDKDFWRWTVTNAPAFQSALRMLQVSSAKVNQMGQRIHGPNWQNNEEMKEYQLIPHNIPGREGRKGVLL